MKGKILLIPLALLLAMSLVATGCPAPAPEVYEWKIQSGYPRGDLSMELLNDFAAAVEARSNGQLKISVFADPEIVPVEQLFEATKKGTLDMLHCGGTFWGGIVPVGEIEFGIPYGFLIPEATSFDDGANIIRKFFYESGFVDLLREEYGKQDLYWLDMHTYGPVPFVISTKPLVTLEDLEGIKIGSEGIWIPWWAAVGAAGTRGDPAEMYMELKLGVIDATQWDVSVVTGMGLHEVAPYWIRGQENDHCIGHMLVNVDSWNALPDDLKAALVGAAEDYWHMTVEAYEAEIEIVEDMAKEDVEIHECWLDEEVTAILAEAAHELWDELAQRDAACAKAIQLIKEWRGVE